MTDEDLTFRVLAWQYQSSGKRTRRYNLFRGECVIPYYGPDMPPQYPTLDAVAAKIVDVVVRDAIVKERPVDDYDFIVESTTRSFGTPILHSAVAFLVSSGRVILDEESCSVEVLRKTEMRDLGRKIQRLLKE